MMEFRAESNRMCSVFVAAMLLGAVPAVDATTIHVPGDYPSIGAALDAAGVYFARTGPRKTKTKEIAKK